MNTVSSKNTLSPNAGLGLVEIVVVAGIISLVFVGLLQLLFLTLKPIGESVRQTEATYLAEEGIEAVKVLRNGGWTGNIASLSNSTTYYPVIASDNWTLTTTDPGAINGTYTRTVVFEAVYRDVDDNIAGTGTVDDNTRKVTTTVTWMDRDQSKSVTLETYITNFRGT